MSTLIPSDFSRPPADLASPRPFADKSTSSRIVRSSSTLGDVCSLQFRLFDIISLNIIYMDDVGSFTLRKTRELCPVASTQPVNRLSTFHWDSPWREKIRVACAIVNEIGVVH